MTITQTATTSFKIEILQGVHNFGPTAPNTFKIALYTPTATIGGGTAVYTPSGEVVGPGYSAGGSPLTITTTPTSGVNFSGSTVAFVSFANVLWTHGTFVARGALIYNTTQGNKTVAVLDFGADKTVNDDTLQIVFPNPDANSAIIRIS